MNELTPYGEGEFEFNQNTVPFDFDGQRLLWMTYSASGVDVRDLFFYDFRYAKKQNIKTFGHQDGMLSNFKLLKSDKLGEAGEWIFFVRNTKHVYRFNADKESKEEFIGSAPDSIIAMSLCSTNLRKKDLLASSDVDLESHSPQLDEDTFYVCCLDESMNVCLMTNKNQASGKFLTHKLPLGNCLNLPKELKNKDLFGMGYPYHIRMYAEKILVITSDYGVLYLEVDGLK